MKIRPSHFTLAGLVLGVAAVFFGVIPALILFSLSFLMDVIDGFYARKHKLVSRRGAFFDSVSDKIVEILFVFYICNFMRVQSLGMLIVGSSLMVSYVKHTAGVKVKTFFDRPQRIIYLLQVVIINFISSYFTVLLLSIFLVLNASDIVYLFVRLYRGMK